MMLLDLIAGLMGLAFGAVVVLAFVYMAMDVELYIPHPFTALGRARWRAKRDLDRRVVALMADGWSEPEARRRAEWQRQPRG
jgi:hypothetical protein